MRKFLFGVITKSHYPPVFEVDDTPFNWPILGDIFIPPTSATVQGDGTNNQADALVPIYDYTEDKMYIQVTGLNDNQDLDITYQFTIPNEAKGWGRNALMLSHKETDITGNCGVQILVRDSFGSDIYSSQKFQSLEFANVRIQGHLLPGIFIPGSVVTVIVRAFVDNNQSTLVSGLSVNFHKAKSTSIRPSQVL